MNGHVGRDNMIGRTHLAVGRCLAHLSARSAGLCPVAHAQATSFLLRVLDSALFLHSRRGVRGKNVTRPALLCTQARELLAKPAAVMPSAAMPGGGQSSISDALGAQQPLAMLQMYGVRHLRIPGTVPGGHSGYPDTLRGGFSKVVKYTRLCLARASQ